MVDARRLSRLLRSVTADIARLHQHAATRDTLLDDEIVLDRVKYRFVTAIEGCLDAAQHIAASEGFEPPADNADAMRVLARHDVIDSDLAAVMAAAVQFRNVLVHRYVEVDDLVVVEHLGRLDLLAAYVTAIDAAFGVGSDDPPTA